VTALDAINEPIILMVGGLAKAQDFYDFFARLKSNVKKVILFGKIEIIYILL
jgi:UDP-N-acetylmuramoylalanine-D-glutamate ligase